MKFLCRHLWVRIAAALILLVSIALMLLGVVLTNTFHKAAQESVLINHKQIVTKAAEEAGLFIKRPQDILSATACVLASIYPAPFKQEIALLELSLNQPIFMRIISVDASGNPLAGFESANSGVWQYPGQALESALRGNNYLSKIKFLDNKMPYVIMAVPIRKSGKPVAALIAEVSLKGILEIVDNIQIGSTGRAFLVSQEGVLIAGSENLNGRKEISSYAVVPGLGWQIILKQDEQEAYSFSGPVKIRFWMIIILSELSAVLLSVIMVELLAKPIKKLTHGIQKIAEGDLEQEIKVAIRDELGELSRSFNNAVKKLKNTKTKDRLSAIAEATSFISAELKNSFVSIKTFMQLFPEKHKDDIFIEKFNRLVPAEISRLDRIFKELSDYSLHYELSKERVDLKEIIRGLLEIISKECAAKRIDLEYNAQREFYYVEADPGRLKQVFMNLFINCIGSMPEGGMLKVSLWELYRDSLYYPPSHIELRIQDTGYGLPPENLQKIFEPFQAAKSASMGLGLNASKNIIEQHNGEILMESQIGKGTTFVVRLPIEAKVN